MDFASDNVSGASAPIIEAMTEAARAGSEGTYGEDRWTKRAIGQLEDLFERRLAVVLVPTGTAANALSLAAVTPPWGGVFCHVNAHVSEEEAGAPEFFTGGAKMIGLSGADGKIAPDALAEAIGRFPHGLPRQVQASALSLSQATEAGTIYRVDEVAALTALAHQAKLAVHMDGARFANALASLKCTPAELTWRAGVDILSFGASKNGALACEAVVVFDPDKAPMLTVQRKRSGHTLSKGRLLGAQLTAYLEDGHWLALASHANAMATALCEGLLAIPGTRLAWPREVNEIFIMLPRAVHEGLQRAGAHYYEWENHCLPTDARARPDEVFVRLIASFETTREQVDAFVAAAKAAVVSLPQ